jgi:hypothetical protein
VAFGTDDLTRAQRFAHAQEGDPYRWGGVGPDGFDCSGFLSACLNVLEDRSNVYVRRFGTGTIASVYDDLGLHAGKGDAGDFSMGVIYPWESSSGIGHVAGRLGSLNVESRGGAGVLVGPDARSDTSALFRHHYHAKIDPPPYPPWPGRYLRLTDPMMTGEDVRKIQAQLNHRGIPCVPDGEFGTGTNHSVVFFQRQQGLEADGVVGPVTWKAAFTAPIPREEP